MKKKILIDSEYLNEKVSVGIVLPEGSAERVMILLHGYNGSFGDMDVRLPLQEYADSKNMIIVLPSMNNGYYMDREGYCVSSFIVKELMPATFEQQRISEDIPVYLAGISMGGYGSLLIGSRYPDRFDKIISVSGAFIAHDVSIGNPQVVSDASDIYAWEYFSKTFQPFDTLEHDPLRNPIEAVIRNDIFRKTKKLILTCGVLDQLYDRNLAAFESFDNNRILFEWFAMPGDHNWDCFDNSIRFVLDLLH